MITLSCARRRGGRLLSQFIANKLATPRTTTAYKVGWRSSSMLAWKISDSLNNQTEVGIRDKLKLMDTRVPTISTPSDVLVKVHSTSINPIDVRMMYGYGRRVLDLLDAATNYEPRITNDRYPLTLGRDFSGEVVYAGPLVQKHYKPGDLVFGAVEPQRPGAHAQYVTVPSYSVSRKPENLSHDQAASIPFVALTAYSALCTFGNLSRTSCSGKQVLVIGGSGGVGSFAIQLLKLWGANVVATCSEEKIEWLEDTLLVDQAICHRDPSQMDTLNGRFDFVLDCGIYDTTHLAHNDIVENSLKYLKPFSQAVYVTLSPPFLNNTDNYGVMLGTLGTLFEAACDTIRGLTSLNSARWAVFMPNKEALDYFARLYEDEAIMPQVSSVFNFDRVPHAFEELDSGNVIGKVIVDVTKFDKDQLVESQSVAGSSSENRRANSAG